MLSQRCVVRFVVPFPSRGSNKFFVPVGSSFDDRGGLLIFEVQFDVPVLIKGWLEKISLCNSIDCQSLEPPSGTSIRNLHRQSSITSWWSQGHDPNSTLKYTLFKTNFEEQSLNAKQWILRSDFVFCGEYESNRTLTYNLSYSGTLILSLQPDCGQVDRHTSTASFFNTEDTSHHCGLYHYNIILHSLEAFWSL